MSGECQEKRQIPGAHLSAEKIDGIGRISQELVSIEDDDDGNKNFKQRVKQALNREFFHFCVCVCVCNPFTG